MAAAGWVTVADCVPPSAWAALPDAVGARGGAQIHMPLPTGTGPLRAGMTGLGGGGTAVAGPFGVGPFGVVPLVVGAGGPVGTMPGRLWSGWDNGPGIALGAGGGDPEDGPREAGGGVVVVG